jgi:hypothetical protein
MSERLQFAHEIIDELRVLKARPPYQPTPDIGLVWVVSQPGTVSKLSYDGIYIKLANLGISNDLKVVEAGIGLVKKITALRLGNINPSLVSRANIDEHGPIFFYNGEDSTTPGFGYPQNEDLAEMASATDFIIPASKMVIGHIDRISTPPQVIGIANFLRTLPGITKVAVVSMAPHCVRVARYLQHYRHLFPEGVILENAPVAETVIGIGSTLREVRKVIKYYYQGYLSKESLWKK